MAPVFVKQRLAIESVNLVQAQHPIPYPNLVEHALEARVLSVALLPVGGVGASAAAHQHRRAHRLDHDNAELLDVVQLGFRRAPGFEHLSHAQYAKLVREQVDKAVARAAEERREKGIKLVGRKAVLSPHWSHRPNTREPRRGLSPRVACRNKWARIEALQRNQAFLDQYRGARADHLAGRDAAFPPGTWWLCRYAGLTCAVIGATAPPT